jgi:molybdopterin molybdotransferase
VSGKEFFKVTPSQAVLELARTFPSVEEEVLPLDQCVRRILSQDIISEIDLPEFHRATMDGYAVPSRSTFGASESAPALFKIVGAVDMGVVPKVSVHPGEAVRIATGGMLPDGADSVVMVEHTQLLDQDTLEVFKSAAPLQHVMEVGEDFRREERVLPKGRQIRPQEMGVLAALGVSQVGVFRQPVVAVISSGDEIVPVEQTPGLSQVRDVNAYTLAGFIRMSGGVPRCFGIAGDSRKELSGLLKKALAETDMVLISGGSSVGARDFTIDVIQALPDAEILVHGVSISPGKPTILARIETKPVWGLPGQVTSAMVVFYTLIHPMLQKIAGLSEPQSDKEHEITAVLSRNVASVHGREDYVRVRLVRGKNQVFAEPILGKSGLIRTMVKADGLIKIDMNSEGLEEGTFVRVVLF